MLECRATNLDMSSTMHSVGRNGYGYIASHYSFETTAAHSPTNVGILLEANLAGQQVCPIIAGLTLMVFECTGGGVR